MDLEMSNAAGNVKSSEVEIFENRVAKQNKKKDYILDNDNSIDDREEGEIVDDYEFIISSDEEHCVRQRIEELEATNEELEQIAKIFYNSGTEYSYPNRNESQMHAKGRFPFIPIDFLHSMHSQRVAAASDVSSLSSVDFPKIKKRKRRQSKVFRSTVSEYHDNKSTWSKIQKCGIHYQNQFHHTKLKGPSRRNNNSISSKSWDPDERTNDGKICILSREELRFALAHSTNTETNSGSLKDRLEKEKNFKSSSNSKEKNTREICTKEYQSIQTVVEDHDNSSDSVSLEEQELRLIALKSAVMKKHLARKKRNAEVAYSPTDFEDMLGRSTIVEGDDDMGFVEVEMENFEDVRNNMEISPISSPGLYLNCNQFRVNDFNTSENTKPVDMDIANSESEDELSQHERINHNWQPIKPIPVPITKMPKTKISYGEPDAVLCPASIQARQFVADSYLESSTLPSLVANIEHQRHFLHSNAHIYPTNNFSTYSSENPVAVDDIHINDKKKSFLNSSKKNYQYLYNNISAKEEDEEESLRALLLSKLSSSQACKAVYNTSTQDPLLPNGFSSEDVDDPETLRSSLLKSMDCRKSYGSPTESILKEAVRRLQTKSYPQNAISSEKDNDSNGVQIINENIDVESPDSVAINLNNTLIDNKILTKQCLKIANKFNDFPNADKQTEKKCKWPNNLLKKDHFSDSRKNINDNVRLDRSIICSDDIYNLKTKSSRNCKNKRTEEKDVDNKMQEVKAKKDLSSEINPLIKKEQTIVNFSKELHKVGDTRRSIPCLSQEETCKNRTEEHDKSLPSITSLSASNKTTRTNFQRTKHFNLLQINTQPKAKSRTSVKLNYSKQVHHKMDTSCSTRFQSHRDENKVLTTNKFYANENICEKPSVRPLSNDVTMDKYSSLNISNIASEFKPSSKLPSSAPISRFISSTDVPKVQVRKLVIKLRASDTETSDDDALNLTESQTVGLRKLSTENFYNSNDSFDNTSPMSLLMESLDGKSSRASSPCRHSAALEPSKSVVSDCFKRNLDTFLKNVRSQVQEVPTDGINEKLSTGILTSFLTPAAVKHLPYASQQEYRRLVHRMQMLEKQKKAKNNTLVPKLDMLKKYESYILKTGVCIISSLDKSLQLVQEAKKLKTAKLRYEKRLQELRSEMDVIQHKVNLGRQSIANIFPKICESNQVLTTLKQRHNKLFRSANDLGKILKGENYRLNNDIKQQIAMKSQVLAMEIKLVNLMECSDNENKSDNKTTDLLKNNQSRAEHKQNNLNDSLQSSETTPPISKKKCTPYNYNITQSIEAPKSLKTVQSNKSEMLEEKVVQTGELCLSRTVQNNIVNDSVEIHEPIIKRCKNADTVLLGENDKIIPEENNFVEHTDKNDTMSITENKRIFIPEYISPLEPLKTPKRFLDPNGIICPYDLMGQCVDESCNYEHLRKQFFKAK